MERNGNSNRYDVIVVGAGPAGSTAARTCAKNNLKTLLLERSKLPRFKACAGGVTLAALRQLDFDLPRWIVERECRGVRIFYNGRSQSVVDEHPVVSMVSRKIFDDYLAHKAEEAGVELRDGKVVSSISVEHGGATVITAHGKYLTRMVIGADGYSSRVRRALGWDFSSNETLFCVTTEVPLPESEILDRFGEFAVVEYGIVDVGYAWLFPKKTHVSAGIGGSGMRPSALAQRLREFLRMQGLGTGNPVRGCVVPISTHKHRIHADRVMIAGDAAGLVDGFTGEGIRFAIASGKSAAAAAVHCHQREDYSSVSMKMYPDLFYDHTGADLICSNRVGDFTFKHKKLVFGMALRNQNALRRYLKTMTGEEHLTAYVRWLKTRLPILALKGAVKSLWEKRAAGSGSSTPLRETSTG